MNNSPFFYFRHSCRVCKYVNPVILLNQKPALSDGRFGVSSTRSFISAICGADSSSTTSSTSGIASEVPDEPWNDITPLDYSEPILRVIRAMLPHKTQHHDKWAQFLCLEHEIETEGDLLAVSQVDFDSMRASMTLKSFLRRFRLKAYRIMKAGLNEFGKAENQQKTST